MQGIRWVSMVNWLQKAKSKSEAVYTNAERAFLKTNEERSLPATLEDSCCRSIYIFFDFALYRHPKDPRRCLVLNRRFGELGWIGILACVRIDFLAQVFPD